MCIFIKYFMNINKTIININGKSYKYKKNYKYMKIFYKIFEKYE